jgi:hypothetical protein
MAVTPITKNDNLSNQTPLAELGSTGLKRWGGLVYEEFLNELKGQRGAQVFNEMSKNDPTIFAIQFVIQMLIRQVDWTVTPYEDTPEARFHADFVKQNLDDMSQPWVDTIGEMLSFTRFGWSWHEEVYKFRLGDSPSPALRSKYSDGLLGWKHLPTRAQESLYRWIFDDNGTVTAMEQQPPPDYKIRCIPATKSLHFRTITDKGNPEGLSILRGAYRPWFMKRMIENIEAIGTERDLTGLPVFWLPPHIMLPNASADDKAVYEHYKKIVKNIKRDEQEGLCMPLAYDDNNNKMYDVTLLTTGGRRQFDTTQIVNRYDGQIARTVVADFIMLGQQQVGSWALADSKTSLFSMALGAWLKVLTEGFNRSAIPNLMRVNGWSPACSPCLQHGDIENIDMKDVGDLITKLSGAGMPLFPDPKLENWIKKQANFPVEETDDQVDDQKRAAGFMPPEIVDEPTTEQTADPKSVLEIAKAVAAREISREGGVAMLVHTMGFDQAAAEQIILPAAEVSLPPAQGSTFNNPPAV